MDLRMQRGSVTAFDGDAIVVPITQAGALVGPPAEGIRRAAGPSVEQEAREIAPIAIGAAIVTGAGFLKAPHVIQVPVCEDAETKVSVESVRRGMRAALVAAARRGLDRIAAPLLAGAEQGLDVETIARAMIDEVRASRQARPSSVTILAADDWGVAQLHRVAEEVR